MYSATYTDLLYGEVELPEFLLELAGTSLVRRLQNISQGVLPQDCVDFTLPSRYEHCHGVAYLAHLVTKANPGLSSRKQRLLIAAALLHDAGNPCLSHLGEWFLKRLTNLDGESNLQALLVGSDTERFLKTYGIDPARVVRYVTGTAKPHSDVLHGSLDVDNIDNVGRFWNAVSGEVRFDAGLLALSFWFKDQRWALIDRCREEAARWQTTRRMVYRHIYSEPHLAAAAMVWHAVDLAYQRGQLDLEFFRLTDSQALDRLQELNPDSARIVRMAREHHWYDNVLTIETTHPSPTLTELCEHPEQRACIEAAVRREAKLPEAAFCCFAGVGKDLRRIDLPFLSADGAIYVDTSTIRQIYRFKGYLDPDCIQQRPVVERALKGFCERMVEGSA